MEKNTEFKDLNLNPLLQKSIEEAGFTAPSEIQALTLEPILEGKDIFAQAETGSGKTAAFVIPILEQILRDEKHGAIEAHESRYAILCPTRELAQQTFKVFEQFGKKLEIESCCVIGGESIDKQKDKIDKGVHVLIATPGRFKDLLKQQVVGLDHCQAVVFDEADRLFDMGFKKDIEYILSKAASDRQLIMLSATSNQDVLRTAYKFNSHPEELRLNEDSLLVDHLDHRLVHVNAREKFPLLITILREQEDAYGIIFCNTQFQTHMVAEWLKAMNFKAKAISGRLAQNKRTSMIADFRSKKITILVCTDVAARGLDIKNVNLVINYDIPQDAANYVHRIGRTGRAGDEDGLAISFCAHEDCTYLDQIHELIGEPIEVIDIDEADFAKDICKKPFIDRKTLKVVERDDKRERAPKKERPNKPKRVEKTQEQRDAEREQRAKERASTPRVDKRFIELTGSSEKSLTVEAMKYFKIDDESLIGFDILEKGRKKFFLFGPRTNKYKFFVRPFYKKLLLPLLINIIKKANLNLFVKVSYKPGSLFITFSGKDEQMLLDNKFELLNAFDHIIRNYLYSKVTVHKNLKIKIKTFKSNGDTTMQKKDDFDETKLVEMAKKAREEVLKSKETFKMKSLNSRDRRIIHQFFQDDKEVMTTSVGDGRFKKIEVSLR